MSTDVAPPRRSLIGQVTQIPLWILAGQGTLVIVTVIGFGVRQNVKPKLFDLLLMMGVGTLFLFGPPRNMRRAVVSLSFLTYLAWAGVSYLWTYNPDFWLNDIQLMIPASLALLVVASLLPFVDVVRGLVVGAYVGIAYTTLYTVLQPGPATSHTDGTAGWSGSFGHKNGLAPFMLYAMLVLLTFEPGSRRRRIGLAVAAITIVMSQSTTTYLAAAVLLPFAGFLRATASAPPGVRGTRLLAGSLVTATVATVSVLYLPVLLDVVGKDPTLSRRTEVWEGVIRAIEQRPWTGYGIGGVWFVQSAEPTRSIVADLGFNVYHAHNGYLEILIHLGVVGLALFAIFLASFLRTALQLMTDHPEISRFAILLVATVLLTSLSEVTTFDIWLMMLGLLHVAMLRLRADDLAVEDLLQPHVSAAPDRATSRRGS